MHGFTRGILMKVQYKAESVCTVSTHNIYIFWCFYIRKDVTIKMKLQASHLKLSVKNQFPCDKLVTALIYEIQ